MKKLRLGLVGVGQMGMRLIEIAPERGHTITAEFKSNFPFSEERMIQAKDRVDVWVDFSHASLTERLVKTVSENNLKLVIGTTGWYDKLDQYADQVKNSKAGVIYAPNFSTGVYTFSKMIDFAASIMSKLKAYDVAIHEVHHHEKVDAPSGTAKSLASTLLKHYEASGLKTKIVPLAPGNTNMAPDTIYVSSSRVGWVVGRHEIHFDSIEDSIELIHDARSRNGFAIGAIRAAEWIYDKTGFYNLDDFFADLLGNQE